MTTVWLRSVKQEAHCGLQKTHFLNYTVFWTFPHKVIRIIDKSNKLVNEWSLNGTVSLEKCAILLGL